MTIGFLVNPDQTHRIIEFELEHAKQFLGGIDSGRVSVAFQEDGSTYAALYSSEARAEGADPNPVASLGRAEAETGNSAFFTDPVKALCGPVIFVGAEGEDIGPGEIQKIKLGIQAVQNYISDAPEEFALWRAAARNVSKQ